MSGWRASWSMVGRWLVYVPNPDGGEEQISLPDSMTEAAYKLAAASDLYAALAELADVFAHDGENSVERFDRLAAMFRKDTGYLAPGKDQPMAGPDQPDGDELRALYDGWYSAKVERARAALAKARGQ